MTRKRGWRLNKIFLHIDFNSYFATVEQQANPRLRGKPIGVSGGDRTKRTVIGAASVEAKRFGVKTGMQVWEARRLCPEIILVRGDSDKYLETTKRFLNILKRYSPFLEVYSIDEVFLEVPNTVIPLKKGIQLTEVDGGVSEVGLNSEARFLLDPRLRGDDKKKRGDDRGRSEDNRPSYDGLVRMALEIKERIKVEIGEWMRVSVGISYNKLMAKFASGMQKPDGLVVISDEQEAMRILDTQPLDEICGIGSRIKSRLGKMGVFNFRQLRAAPKEVLILEFKSYGEWLYNASRGIDFSPIVPFYEKEEVKSVGHRLTIDHDTDSLVEIKQILLKLTELVARKLRAKKLVGKTVSCWFRYKIDYSNYNYDGGPKPHFEGDGMQSTIMWTDDGLDIFKAAFSEFLRMWDGSEIRMVGVSISNLRPQTPQNLSFLEEMHRREVITRSLDKINDKYGEFTLQRGILLGTRKIKRMPNSFLADRRFKI